MKNRKGILYVFIANLINLVISLFTGFVLPKILSIETYSSIRLFQLYITYIGVVSLGFVDGMYLRVGGKDVEQLEKKQILEEFKTFKYFQTVVTIIAIGISVALKNEMLLFCSIVILPINIGGYLRNLYQATGQFKRYSRFTNINTLLLFLVNVFLLLIVRTDNYIIYIGGYIIAYILYGFMIQRETVKVFGKQKVKYNNHYLVEDIKNGIFLMIGNFCNVIFTGIDRIFVQNLLGSIKFAFYSFAVSVENLMNVFMTPISTVMYNYLCNHKEKENVVKIKRLILVFATFIVSVLFPVKFIVNLWLSKYNEALTVLLFLFAAQYISMITRCIHVNLYKATKKQNRYFMIMVGIVILSVILNMVLYSIYPSMEMIALATLIVNIIWFLVGEIDFKEYRLQKKDYLYIFIILISFLICGQLSNTIIAFFIYGIFAIIFSVCFLNKTVKYCCTEGIGFVKNALDKIKKKGSN